MSGGRQRAVLSIVAAAVVATACSNKREEKKPKPAADKPVPAALKTAPPAVDGPRAVRCRLAQDGQTVQLTSAARRPIEHLQLQLYEYDSDGNVAASVAEHHPVALSPGAAAAVRARRAVGASADKRGECEVVRVTFAGGGHWQNDNLAHSDAKPRPLGGHVSDPR